MLVDHEESVGLNRLDVVQIIANCPRKRSLADLKQLIQSKHVWIFVPKSISFSQIQKLLTQDAGKSRADETSHDWPLCKAAGEKIDVINAVVNLKWPK